MIEPGQFKFEWNFPVTVQIQIYENLYIGDMLGHERK
jgi:hypothetical protein